MKIQFSTETDVGMHRVENEDGCEKQTEVVQELQAVFPGAKWIPARPVSAYATPSQRRKH